MLTRPMPEEPSAEEVERDMAIRAWIAKRAKERRLLELEEALKTEPSKAHRRELVIEYLRLTDPEPQEISL